jgi:4-amino-4-deoxy-L-arabinose transferase-like glycosyltransferase
VAAPTSNRLISVLALIAVVVTAVVYCRGLDDAPVYLTKDEASYGIQSHAVATTGRDLNGRRFPLYFQEPGFSIGRDPLYIYATALILQARPLTAGALRIPTTVAAAVSVGLIVLVAFELFGSASLAVIAAILLAVTPVFFIRSRAALSVILPVPFQLLWLWFLLRYMRIGRLRDLVAGTAALGLGVYSYMSMLFFAPLHMLFSLAEVARQRRWRHGAIAIAVLALLILPVAVWQLTHPGRATDIVSSYRVYPAGLTPLQGLKDVLSWPSLAVRSDIYWSAFNPSRLFFSGESSYVDSTRTAGLFPVVYLLLLPLGALVLLRRPLDVPRVAIVATFLIGPIPGVLVGTETIGRYLIAAPLAALLATAAIGWLWRSGWLIARAIAAVALVMSVVLFAGFVKQYMGDWRIDSATYFGGNFRGAIETVLATPRASAPTVVYLSEHIPYASVLWEFYRRAHGRDDLAGRDRGLRLEDSFWRETSGTAMAIVPAGDDPSAATMTAAGWRVVAQVHEFYGGPPTFAVLARP